ncbi:hypothetical protein C8J57DRAFT_1508502 [Mycena rebaudengoi]|nr:hypothetical protein C8J57DRAFT_1508502 [Mycena rebaudengoi]
MDSAALPSNTSELITYVLDRRSLASSSLGEDIYPPVAPATTYTTAAGLPYIGVVFGELTHVIHDNTSESRVYRLGPGCTPTKKLFTSLVSGVFRLVLADYKVDDPYDVSTVLHPPSAFKTPSGKNGTYLDVLVPNRLPRTVNRDPVIGSWMLKDACLDGILGDTFKSFALTAQTIRLLNMEDVPAPTRDIPRSVTDQAASSSLASPKKRRTRTSAHIVTGPGYRPGEDGDQDFAIIAAWTAIGPPQLPPFADQPGRISPQSQSTLPATAPCLWDGLVQHFGLSKRSPTEVSSQEPRISPDSHIKDYRELCDGGGVVAPPLEPVRYNWSTGPQIEDTYQAVRYDWSKGPHIVEGLFDDSALPASHTGRSLPFVGASRDNLVADIAEQSRRDLYRGWEVRLLSGWKKGCFGTVKSTSADELSVVLSLEHSGEMMTAWLHDLMHRHSGLLLKEARTKPPAVLKSLQDSLEAENMYVPLIVADLPRARFQWPEITEPDETPTPSLPTSHPIAPTSAAGLPPGEWLRQPALAGQSLDLLVKDNVFWKGKLYEATAYVERVPAHFRRGDDAKMEIKIGIFATNIRKIRLIFLEPLTTNELDGRVTKTDAVSITKLFGVQVVIIGPTVAGDWKWVGHRGRTEHGNCIAIGHHRLFFPLSSICRSDDQHRIVPSQAVL